MRALGQAPRALDALAALLPDAAERIGPAGRVESVGLDELAPGDLVLVRSGGRLPADGVVEDGAAELDESMITGESRPVPKRRRRPGRRRHRRDRLRAAGPGRRGRRADRAGRHPAAGRAGPGVPLRAQALADRAAAALFWFAAGAGVLTFAVWLALGEPAEAVERTVTVLVIACPHALGLAIPLVIAISTAMAARAGILVKDRLALERMRTVDAVLFDKTGTLTKGSPAVVGVAGTTCCALAAAVEQDSEHPLARAVVAAASGGACRRRRGSGPGPAAGCRPWSTGRPSRSAARHCCGRPAPGAGRAGGAGRALVRTGADRAVRAARRHGRRRAGAGRRDPAGVPGGRGRAAGPAAYGWR